MKFKVFRTEYGTKKSRYDTFEVPQSPGLTVLGALFYIQEHLDNSLSFRYSCRGAVCGSCGILVNKFPVLACRTQVSDIEDSKLELKPFVALSSSPVSRYVPHACD